MKPSSVAAHRGGIHRKEDSDETHRVLIGSYWNFIPTAEHKTHKKNWRAKLRTPKGSSRKAQGVSPGFRITIARSPERAAQQDVSIATIVILRCLHLADTSASPLQGFLF